MKKLLTLLFVFLLSAPSWGAALPSINQVYGAASSGNLQLAQSEINQVLAAYPNSAKAHYVDARVLALEGRWQQAAGELATAQRLEPGLPFEHADTLAAFAQQVAAHTAAAQPAQRSGFPLMGVLGVVLAVIAVIALLRLVRASRQPPVQVITPQGWQGGVPPQPGYGAGPGYYPQGPGGGGFMGAVGTGLGLGAGMAAGEMLVDKMFDHHAAPGGGFMPDANAATPLPDDQNFGIADSGSWGDSGGGGDWGGGGSDSWS